MEVGKPINFDIDLHIKAINQMICADELEIALDMTDKLLPGYYRDHKPKELIELKKDLQKCIFDHYAYIESESTICDKDAIANGFAHPAYFPRSEVIKEHVKKLNDKNITPWIMEIGPGLGCLPLGLQKHGCRFNYLAKSLSQTMIGMLKDYVPTWMERPNQDQNTIFVAYELLEHMHNPDDIRHTFVRANVEFDTLFISTPKYTANNGHQDWRGHALGHLRTWTPTEFIQWGIRNFPEYSFEFVDSGTMILIGNKKKD